MSNLDLKNLLNEEQEKAVLTTEGPVLVLSGAGSGKTRVIIYRIAYLLSRGVSPENILAVTFTNKAAREMKERIVKYSGLTNSGVLISTFHSMCAQFLRNEAENIGLNKNFSICDVQDQRNIIKQCLMQLNLDEKRFVPNIVSSIIGRAKDDMISVDEFKNTAAGRQDMFYKLVADVYELYQKILENSQNLDFGDLQFKTVEMLQTRPDILQKYQERFKYIMIDEFQDTNYSQYLMIKLLAGKYKNICVVGDDDQSIYSWRGADIQNILNFEKDYEKTKIIKLEQNYRSTKNILETADRLVKNNKTRKNKTIWTENESGESVKYRQVLNENAEAEEIAREIEELINQGFSLNDIAIFYRTNAQSRVFEEIFRKYGIPYILVGSTKFYDRKEVKDVLAYLKVLINPNDTINLKRIINVPARGIGDTTIDLIESLREGNDSFFDILTNICNGFYAENVVSKRISSSVYKFYAFMTEIMSNINTLSVKEIINLVLEKNGYMQSLYDDTTIYRDSRIENVMELVSAADDYQKRYGDITLEGFLQHTALVSDVDKLNLDTPKVTLMTIHLAKGLEFPVVFLTGMEEGLFPNQKVDYNKDELEEERRLCFVGMTRAMKKLYCFSASQRNIYGMTKWHLPSRFLRESGLLDEFVDDETIEINPYARFDDFVNKTTVETNDGFSRQANSFKKGDRVSHPNFGIGTIKDFYGDGDKETVYIKFYSGQEKRLLVKYAKLSLA